MMKLYWGPHTCAIGIHVLLEEIGRPYETEEVDVAGGATHEQPFQSVNPKGKVPVLVRDDGSVLTEFGAIATWLARTNPDKSLLPDDPEGETRAFEILEYVEGTLHGQGFGRIFLPQQFQPPDVVHETLGLGTSAIKKQGRQIAERALAILNAQLEGRDYAGGSRFTIADAALFYAERWAPQVDIALPPNLARHFAMMTRRPAVERVRRIWNEA